MIPTLCIWDSLRLWHSLNMRNAQDMWHLISCNGTSTSICNQEIFQTIQRDFCIWHWIWIRERKIKTKPAQMLLWWNKLLLWTTRTTGRNSKNRRTLKTEITKMSERIREKGNWDYTTKTRKRVTESADTHRNWAESHDYLWSSPKKPMCAIRKE